MNLLRIVTLLAIAMLLELGNTSMAPKNSVQLYKNPLSSDELISNIEAPSAALKHSFAKFRLFLDDEEHKGDFQPSDEETLDAGVAIGLPEGSVHNDSSASSDNDTFTVNLASKFLKKELEWEGFKDIECKLLLFDLGKGDANFSLGSDQLNETKLDERFQFNYRPLFDKVGSGKKRAVLVSLPSTFDRLAEEMKANLSDVTNSTSEGTEATEIEKPPKAKTGADLDAMLQHLGIGGGLGGSPLRSIAGGRGLSPVLASEESQDAPSTDHEVPSVQRHNGTGSFSGKHNSSETENATMPGGNQTDDEIEEVLSLMKEGDSSSSKQSFEILISKRALQERIVRRTIAKVEDDPTVDIIFFEVKQGATFMLSASLEEKKIVLPLYEAKFAQLLKFLKADTLEDPLLNESEVNDPKFMLQVLLQNITTPVVADFEFEHHYNCGSFLGLSSVYFGLVFCFLVLTFMSIRMTSCENERGTSLGQKIIIIPNCLKLMTTSLTYYYFDQCPWVDVSFSQYLLSLKMTWLTLESTFMTMAFLLVLSGFQISHSSFERHLKLKYILTLTLFQYVLDSTYQIVWTGEYTNELRFVIHALMNCFSLIMLVLAIIVGYSNYQSALTKARETTDYIFFNNRVNDANYDAVQYYLNRLCDRAKMTLASTLIIALYYMSELFIHGFIDLYLMPLHVRSQGSNNTVQLLHSILDLTVLYCLTFAISPHFYFLPGFVRRLFLCPYNVCLPNVHSQAYIDAMNRFQLRPDFEVEEQIEMEMVSQTEDRSKVKFGELNLKKLSKDHLAIDHLLKEGDRVNEDSLKLYIKEPKIKDLMSADENEELLIVVNPMEPHYLFDEFFHGCLQEATWAGGLEEGKKLDFLQVESALHDMRDQSEPPNELDESQLTSRSLLE